MAKKKPAKKTMSKKALKGTKGGAVDAFIWFTPSSGVQSGETQNTWAGNVNSPSVRK